MPPQLIPLCAPRPKFVPSKVKLAESVSEVPVLLAKIRRLAVRADNDTSDKSVKAEAPLAIPREEVATHSVPVAVVCKTMPAVPAELVESWKAPVANKLPTIVSLALGVVVPIPKLPVVVKVISCSPVEEATAKGLMLALLCTKSEAVLVAVVVPTRRPPRKEVPPW